MFPIKTCYTYAIQVRHILGQEMNSAMDMISSLATSAALMQLGWVHKLVVLVLKDNTIDCLQSPRKFIYF